MSFCLIQDYSRCYWFLATYYQSYCEYLVKILCGHVRFYFYLFDKHLGVGLVNEWGVSGNFTGAIKLYSEAVVHSDVPPAV